MTWGRRVVIRLYRIGLLLLPRQMRARFGSEMVDLFEREWEAERGIWRRARLGARSAWGLAWSALMARVQPLAHAGVEPYRAEVGGSWLRDALSDVAFAIRTLYKRPGFSLAVIVTLVLGIGLNSAMFSLVHGLLLRPLPYGEPHRLVQLSETAPDLGSMDVSLPDFDLWRARTQVFDGMFAFDDTSFLLETPDRPEIVEGAVVSPGFLQVLGVAPTLGRGFLATEERPGADGVVLISSTMWERRFARSPDVVGRTMNLNGRAREIVGVAPDAFHFPEMADVWVPLAFDSERADATDYSYDVVARLGDGESIQAALAESELIAAELARTYPDTKSGIGATAYALRSADVPTPLAAAVLMLQVAVGLVLLVACTNGASLILARGHDRRREMVIRRALGASAGRIVRQVLTETGVLCFAGLLGATWMAHTLIRALPALLPDARPFWLAFDMNPLVLGWTAGAGVVACLITGLPPALQSAGKSAVVHGKASVSLGSVRRWLLGAQIALATVLVAGATLASRALVNLNRVDPGVNPDRVLVLAAPLPPWSYPEQESRVQLVRQAIGAVGNLPTVVAASAVGSVPFVGTGSEVAVESDAALGTGSIAHLNSFTPDYFATVQAPVVAGALPTDEDTWDGSAVAVVSASLAARLWPGEDAVGRSLRHALPGSRSPTVSDDQPWLRVAAVVGDVRQAGVANTQLEQVYVPIGRATPGSLTLVVRTTDDPLSQVDAVRERVHRIDATLPFYEPTTLELARESSVWTVRLSSRLMLGFAVLALVLAFIGLYGVVAFTTRQRDRELGLRLAVGASPKDVLGLVLRGAIATLTPGLVVGMLGAGAVSLAFRGVLYGVPPLDPVTLAITGGGLMLVGLAAAFRPALRAVRLDPSVALRAD